jgi:Ala-tRNA(Pro) deacylase
MSISARLKGALESAHIPYEVRSHPQAFTASGVAEAEHVPGREVAKVVMLRSGHDYFMAVVSATHRVDEVKLRHLVGKADLHLADEDELLRVFPDCERGAMPPFGNLYGVPVLVDEHLAREHEIAFNAGTHVETIHMAYEDFARLVRPRVASFAASAAP